MEGFSLRFYHLHPPLPCNIRSTLWHFLPPRSGHPAVPCSLHLATSSAGLLSLRSLFLTILGQNVFFSIFPAFLPAAFSILPFFFIPPSCHTSFRTVRPICAVCAIWRQNSSSTPSSCSDYHFPTTNLAFHYVPIRSHKISDHRHFSLSMFDVSQLRLLIL